MRPWIYLKSQVRITPSFGVRFASLFVTLHGAFIIATALVDLLLNKHLMRQDASIDVSLLIGLSLIYLGSLLGRRKFRAWAVTLITYAFYVGTGTMSLIANHQAGRLTTLEIVRSLVLPLILVILLFSLKGQYVVRSESRSYAQAARFALLLFVIATLYGVFGFTLMDKSDFHREIPVRTALHYTLDQLNITTDAPLHPYTRRAHAFVDSLSLVSIVAAGYVIISFFEPLRAHLTDQSAGRERMRHLLLTYGSQSEDYFKLWPHDKLYFFDRTTTAGLAYRVYRGVAICLADPVGNPHQFDDLLTQFTAYCFRNDWLPALVHTEDTLAKTYKKHDFELQKLGEEAVVDLEHFQGSVVSNKYFRHIRNKFTKQDFTTELLMPPHHQAIKDRLRVISDDWLSNDGRTERGFVMGYFRNDYIDMCPIMVVRDAAGTIQAFLNQVPADFDTEEATYDMLRYTRGSTGNINDFLLLSFIAELQLQGYKRLNLGLCPLVGLDSEDDTGKGLPDTVLRFAYANGDRFYSFSGLHRFKAKYEPTWRDRYIVYRGGVRGFSRTMNALLQIMKIGKN